MKNSPGLRIAIVGSPRSGNTWLHCLLSAIYQVTVRAVHRPSDLSWSNLPEDCIVQLHWHPTSEFRELLCEHGFQTVVLARHPLDVLISILHFSNHEREIGQWLDGELGDEQSLINATPLSHEFLAYAESRRASALLGLSREWNAYRDVAVVRYEDLVADPLEQLLRLTNTLGVPVCPERISQAILEFNFDALQKSNNNHHFWKGKPGLWRSFLPSALAQRIGEIHRKNLAAFDYSCDPDEHLTREQAEDNWNFQQIKPTVAYAEKTAAEHLLHRVTELESKLLRAEQELAIYRGAAQMVAMLDAAELPQILPLEQARAERGPEQIHFAPGQFFSHVGKGVKNGILIPPGVAAGYVVFGPYLKLPVGRYQVRYRFAADILPSDRLRLDVIYSPSGEVLAERHWSTGPLATLEFEHRDPAALLEYRIYSEGQGETHPSLFTGVVLERIPEAIAS